MSVLYCVKILDKNMFIKITQRTGDIENMKCYHEIKKKGQSYKCL
jgi:hypothetical protein